MIYIAIEPRRNTDNTKRNKETPRTPKRNKEQQEGKDVIKNWRVVKTNKKKLGGVKKQEQAEKVQNVENLICLSSLITK